MHACMHVCTCSMHSTRSRAQRTFTSRTWQANKRTLASRTWHEQMHLCLKDVAGEQTHLCLGTWQANKRIFASRTWQANKRTFASRTWQANKRTFASRTWQANKRTFASSSSRQVAEQWRAYSSFRTELCVTTRVIRRSHTGSSATRAPSRAPRHRILDQACHPQSQ